MSSLTFERLRMANVTRCNAIFHGLHDWSPTDWATAVAGEVGEACTLIKKLRRGDFVDWEEIGHELADAVIYIDLLAARLGLDLEDCIRRKFDEVSARRGWIQTL